MRRVFLAISACLAVATAVPAAMAEEVASPPVNGSWAAAPVQQAQTLQAVDALFKVDPARSGTSSASGVPTRLGSPPMPSATNLISMIPRLGAFDLTFYSATLPGGYDAMFTAEVVVSLTRRF